MCSDISGNLNYFNSTTSLGSAGAPAAPGIVPLSVPGQEDGIIRASPVSSMGGCDVKAVVILAFERSSVRFPREHSPCCGLSGYL